MRNVSSIGFLLLALIGQAQTGPGGVGSSSTNILWLDANYHVTISSGAVSGWSDRSGNGNNASQTAAAQRPLLTGSVPNGYPAIKFDNDQTNYDFLRVPDNSTLEGMNGLTSFVVYQLLSGTAAAAPRCFFSKRDGVDNQEAYDWFLWNSGSNVVQNLDIDNTSHRATSSGNYLPGTTYLNSFIYHGATPSDMNDQTLYDGNTAVGNRSEGSTSIPNYTSDLYVGILRGHTGAGVNVSRFNGYISEIILYNTVLNNAQRIIVNNYLSAKYNTALASSNVYRQDDPGQGNYDHEVAGLGRTNSTNTQTDSRSGVLQISNPTGLGDNEFLMWGHDNGALGTYGVGNMPADVEARWQRTWRTSEVNATNTAVDVGAVDITFDLSTSGSGSASDLRLLVDTDNDGDFSDETSISGATLVSGAFYRFSGVTALSNNGRFTLGTINSTRTPLPVQLLSFEGEALPDGRARLSWSTASEANSADFTVQRSEDLANWRTVDVIPAAGSSQTSIQYGTVDQELRTQRSYYRLQQHDLDASYTFSHIIALDAAAEVSTQVWPNPVVGSLNIRQQSGTMDHLALFDALGRTVLSMQPDPSNTINVLDLGTVPVGAYVLQVSGSGGTSQHHVFVGTTDKQ